MLTFVAEVPGYLYRGRFSKSPLDTLKEEVKPIVRDLMEAIPNSEVVVAPGIPGIIEGTVKISGDHLKVEIEIDQKGSGVIFIAFHKSGGSRLCHFNERGFDHYALNESPTGPAIYNLLLRLSRTGFFGRVPGINSYSLDHSFLKLQAEIVFSNDRMSAHEFASIDFDD